MNFGQAVSNCFSNYITLSGRAPRSEYWYWTLFMVVGSICALIADGLIIGDLVSQPINLIFNLATMLPCLAVSVRRLHDINKSGWWVLISLTIIGVLLLLYWAVQPSDPHENDY